MHVEFCLIFTSSDCPWRVSDALSPTRNGTPVIDRIDNVLFVKHPVVNLYVVSLSVCTMLHNHRLFTNWPS